MTPKELISTLKQLHEAATPGPWHTDKNRHPTTDGLPWGWLAWKRHEAGGSPANIPGLTCHWKGKQGRANAELLERLRNELPRIIRLLEAGEMVAKAADEFVAVDITPPNQEADPCQFCGARSSITAAAHNHFEDCELAHNVQAALSAYEEAGKYSRPTCKESSLSRVATNP